MLLSTPMAGGGSRHHHRRQEGPQCQEAVQIHSQRQGDH